MVADALRIPHSDMMDRDKVEATKKKLGSHDARERAAAASDLASYGPCAAAYEGLGGSIAKLLTDKNEDVRAAACTALADVGEAAVPFIGQLSERVLDKDLYVRQQAVRALGLLGSIISGSRSQSDVARQALVGQLGSTQGRMQAAVVQSLSALGAEPFVNEVVELLKSEHLEVRRAALQCLGRIKNIAKDHVKAIVSSLDEPLVRTFALHALANAGERAEDCLSDIIPFLRDGDGLMRAAAIEAVGQLADWIQQDDVSTIAELVSHHHPAFRCAGLMALGRLGWRARHLVPDLRELLFDEDWELFDQKVPVLRTDGYGTPASVLEQLRAPLLSKPYCAAAAALAKLGSPSEDLLSVLAKHCVWHHDPDLQVVALNALQEVGITGSEQITYVARLLKDKHCAPHVRASALQVLADFVLQTSKAQTADDDRWMINERINSCLTRLAEATRDQDPNVQAYAVHALGAAGPRAAVHCGLLARLLEDRGNPVLTTAVKAIGNIGKDAIAFAPIVAELLDDSHMHVRHNAVEALGNMGAEAFVVEVANLLWDPSCHVRTAVVVALGRMGQAGADRAAAIAALLDDSFSVCRRASCTGLGKLLADGQSLPANVVEKLRGTLIDDFESVREAAAETLRVCADANG